MWCVIVHTVQDMSVGSKDVAKFWCWLVLLSVRVAKKQFVMVVSVSKEPIVGVCVLVVVPVLMSVTVVVLVRLRAVLL